MVAVSVIDCPKMGALVGAVIAKAVVVVVAEAMPVPVRTTWSAGAFCALLLSTSVSVRTPVIVAWKVASISHPSPATTVPALAQTSVGEPRLKSPVSPVVVE
jgi:hypothetical protein